MHSYSVLNRYNTKTRIGNWYQQSQLHQFNFKQHLHSKVHNQNQTLNTKTKIGFSSQFRDLTDYGDGLVRFGDSVCVGSERTRGVLAFNVNEAILGEETYAVTTTKNLEPALRNVFRIVAASETGDAMVKYGDKIRFEAEAAGKKLYVQSLAASPMRSSKFSRLQEVSVTASLNSSSLWVIQHEDPKLRFSSVGQPMVSGDTLLIKHCTTGQWLGSDLVAYVNDFGKEFEVYAKSWLSNNKTQNLAGEKTGHISVENPLRDQDERNGWRILKGK